MNGMGRVVCWDWSIKVGSCGRRGERVGWDEIVWVRDEEGKGGVVGEVG